MPYLFGVRLFSGLFFLLFAFFISPAHSEVAQDGEVLGRRGTVNVYSYRQPHLMKPLFELFEIVTGIKVRAIFASRGLIERMIAEGRNSPADVLLTVDISRLMQAAQSGVTQAVDSHTLRANIPARFRDPDSHWFALSSRARVVYASRERVAQDQITYAELADPKWKGKLCTRSGQHDYSLGLIASIIAHEGHEEAEIWLNGLRKNLARKPSGNDRSQIKAIFFGKCDLALGNTYYMGLMETEEREREQRLWAKSVKILFPNSGDRGTHVNISGMAMARYAPNPKGARLLMEFLSSAEAQRTYAKINFEYPVKDGVAVSEQVQGWGEMKPDSLSLDEIGKLRSAASELVDKVGFDRGPD